MPDDDLFGEQFEQHRSHLRSVAYRMLGSLSEADDAVQETWLRLRRAAPDDVRNLRGWLTTVTARICLNMLRARANRREEQLAPGGLPDPVITLAGTAPAPDQEAVLADSVGLALMVVLDTLAPAERLALVLHDMFGLPFEEIGGLVGRTPAATRQLASRARRRIQGRTGDTRGTEADPAREREVVDAFFRAARAGDLPALVAVLDPGVVLRSDLGGRRLGAPTVFHGPDDVATQAVLGALPGAELVDVLVNGRAGVLVTVHGRPFAVLGFVVTGHRVVEIDAIADPERVARLAPRGWGSADVTRGP